MKQIFALLSFFVVIATISLLTSRKSDRINVTSKSLDKFQLHHGSEQDNMFIIEKIQSILSSVNFENPAVTADVDYTYKLNELKAAMNMQNYLSNSWGCEKVSKIVVGELKTVADDFYIYKAVYNNSKHILVQTSKYDVEKLISSGCGLHSSDKSQSNQDRCFLMKNSLLIKNSISFNDLTNHRNIAKMQGICIQNSKNQVFNDIKSSGVYIFYENNDPFVLHKAKRLPFLRRLNICSQLLNLAEYLSNSHIGSVLLKSWIPDNFVFDGDIIKLQTVKTEFSLTEKSCFSNQQCSIKDIGVDCLKGTCQGFNSKKNLLSLSTEILLELLSEPDGELDEDSSLVLQNLVVGLQHLQLSTKQAIYSVNKLARLVENNRESAKLIYSEKEGGMIIDTSQRRAIAVKINEITAEKFVQQQQKQTDKTEKLKSEPKKAVSSSSNLNSLEMFERKSDVDFPRSYNFNCPSLSQASWGCVVTADSLQDIADLCLREKQCKSFVVIPDKKNPKVIIAVLKNEDSDFEKRPGVISYVLKMNKEQAMAQVFNSTSCLSQSYDANTKSRNQHQVRLVEAFDSIVWNDMTWEALASDVLVKKASNFKRPSGKSDGGGQMNVVLETGKHGDIDALFVAKEGEEEFSSAQLLTYQLDRLLGLYKTPPVVERVMSPDELKQAGFPTDEGGNKFDEFKKVKFEDGSLMGVLLPTLDAWTVEHHISVPKLDSLTESVTPFSKKQVSDLEYLLLGHLASLPMPSKHISSKGLLIFTKTDNAFQSASDPASYLNYFNNCQFTSNMLRVHEALQQNNCKLSGEVQNMGQFMAAPPSFSQVVDGNFGQFSSVVDECLKRFGRSLICTDCK